MAKKMIEHYEYSAFKINWKIDISEVAINIKSLTFSKEIHTNNITGIGIAKSPAISGPVNIVGSGLLGWLLANQVHKGINNDPTQLIIAYTNAEMQTKSQAIMLNESDPNCQKMIERIKKFPQFIGTGPSIEIYKKLGVSMTKGKIAATLIAFILGALIILFKFRFAIFTA